MGALDFNVSSDFILELVKRLVTFQFCPKKAGYQADSIYLPIPTKSSQLELNCKLAGGYMVDVVQASYSSETSFLDCITIYRYSTCSLL